MYANSPVSLINLFFKVGSGVGFADWINMRLSGTFTIAAIVIGSIDSDWCGTNAIYFLFSVTLDRMELMEKKACLPCIKGHRASSCTHHLRPQVAVKRKGRKGCEFADSLDSRSTHHPMFDLPNQEKPGDAREVRLRNHKLFLS